MKTGMISNKTPRTAAVSLVEMFDLHVIITVGHSGRLKEKSQAAVGIAAA